MQKIIDFLISYARERDYKVKNVTVGLNWTCVLSKNLGMAMTYKIGREVKDASRLEEMTTSQLANYLKSWNLLESSIGLAAINSVVDPPGNAKRGISGLEIGAEVGKGKKVVMIGKFPDLEKFKKQAREFIVLELDPNLINPEEGILPSTASESVIEDADVLVITATTIINKSVDRLVELGKKAFKILVGPSTPMIKDLLEYFDVLAGVRINDPYAVMKRISQGLGMVYPNKFPNNELEFIALER